MTGLRLALAALLALAAPAPARAGAFVVAGDGNLDVIAHPIGYDGTGGALTISVCIDPTSAHAASMVVPTQNIINTWNELTPTTPNLVFGNLPGLMDWESVALHELGHCGFALAHPNLASESGLSDDDTNYTRSTDGGDDFDLDDGADGVIGSGDDVRGNDVNLHWFRIANNNPFTIAPVVDATTYTRDTAALPPGHLFAANADYDVSTLLGFPDTEAVMQQGAFSNEEQRTLNHDDVATALLGAAGLDEMAGTADDYTVTFVYAGLTAACDLVLDFDNTEGGGLAACGANLTNIAADHWSIVTGNLFFSTGASWFFNQVPSGPTVTPTPTLSPTPTITPTPLIDHAMLYKVKASVRNDLPNNGRFPPANYNLQLDDALLANAEPDDPENYQVKQERDLALPAVKNAGTPLYDDALHYLRYQLKEAKEGAGPFDPGNQAYPRAVKHKPRIWGLLNQFGTIKVETKRVEALLVPAAKSLVAPPAPPANATHYKCYQAKATRDVTDQTPDVGGGTGKFRKDIEAYFGDQFLDVDCAVDREGDPTFPGSPVAGTCLFNLRRVVALCNPVVKSDVGGVPPRVTIAPPGSSSTPTSSESLLCYQVKLSSRVLGAGAAALGNVGVGTLLKQRKHVKRSLPLGTAPHTAPGNQFPAPLQVDTKKTEFACVPTFVTSIVDKP